MSDYLEKDGTVAMTGDLNVGENLIKNVSFPHQKNDAANKEYVEKQIDRIATHPDHYKDVFSYLMSSGSQWTDEITEYDSFIFDKIDNLSPSSGNFHNYNHKVIYLTIIKHYSNGGISSAPRRYRFKIGMNFYRLKGNTNYTLCLELLNTNQTLWNKAQISIDKGTSTGLTITHDSITKHTHNFTNSNGQSKSIYYHRIIVNFRKLSSGNKFFLHILVNIQINPFIPTSLPNPFSGVYLIAYGVEGTVSNIDPDKVYDYHSAFVIKPTEVVYNVDINTNNKKILNIALDKNNNNSAATVGMVKEIHPFTTNNIYRQYFERFYDFTNASQYSLTRGSYGVVINGLKSTNDNRLNNIGIPLRHLRDIQKEGINVNNYVISFSTPNHITEYTLCFVFYLWRNRSFTLTKYNSVNDSSLLILKYDKTNNKLSLTSGSSTDNITIPSDSNGKRIVVWLAEKFSSNVTKVKISNYSSTITMPAVQYSTFQYFEFTTEGGVLNKLMLSKNFYDFDSEQYHKLIIQEKLNGSYLE